LKKGQTKLREASLPSFQLQFEVIVLGVFLASSSEQQCPDEKTHFLSLANCASLAHCYRSIQINVTRKQQMQMLT
jgi:hypothetical protein